MSAAKPTQPVTDPAPRLRSLRALMFRFILAPALFLALLLGTLFTLQQMHDRRQLLLSHGRASAEQLAALIELTDGQPLEGRLELVNQSLLNLMLERDMIRSVRIYRMVEDTGNAPPELKLIMGVGPRPGASLPVEELIGRQAHIRDDPGSLRVMHPLNAQELTCWLSIELHRPYFLVGNYQILLVGLLGLIASTLAALAWATFLSERWAQILARIRASLDAIGKGRFNTRVQGAHNQELNLLAEQINEMAKGLASHQRDYQENLHQSIEDLRQSLDSMEEQNIELDLSRKKALEASRVKSNFLANTSHEIRTPLNGIIGFTNLLLKTELDELQQDYLHTILRSSENLLTTINDILDFSRIESGNLVLDHIPMNLGHLLEETLQILAPFAYENQLELVPLIDPQLPTTVIGDPLRIKQVLTSLVSNAVRSSSQGNIPVRLSVQRSKESDLMVRISVTDIGNRIDEQGRRELQQLLSQKVPGAGQQISSNGLGLAIARSLIERMQGSVGMDAASGGGTTLWLHIPLLLDRNRGAQPQERFPGCRLLLADPNRMTRLQVAQLLKHWQVEAVELADTETLLPVVEQMWKHDALPDALIVDTALAADDFEHFVGLVQQLVDTYQCRVIVQGSPVDLRRCYEQLRTRALAFLGKPVTRDNLLRALRRAAPQQPVARPTGSQPALNLPTKPRVLAVDDHEANRHLVSELLRAQDIDVTLAASGEEALRLWRDNDFNLIFMDIQMPEVDGIETTRRIRAEEQGARIPIIALTAHAGAEEKARLLAAGLDDYLSKPVSESQLNHMIKRWMKILSPATPAPPAAQVARLVDIEESLSLSNKDPKLARDMLQMLIRGLLEDEQELNRLHGERDHRGLFELVHRMHGGCCYCGVPRLREVTAKLQEALRPMQEQQEAEINELLVKSVAREIRALREWASEQDLDALFGIQEVERSSV